MSMPLWGKVCHP